MGIDLSVFLYFILGIQVLIAAVAGTAAYFLIRKVAVPGLKTLMAYLKEKRATRMVQTVPRPSCAGSKA